jgi:hypothetical protein
MAAFYSACVFPHKTCRMGEALDNANIEGADEPPVTIPRKNRRPCRKAAGVLIRRG